MSQNEQIQQSIISDMSEGVMTIRKDGIIDLVNPAAAAILGMDAVQLVGKSFASCFFADEYNDAFTQTVLDAVYWNTSGFEKYVPYRAGEKQKQLRVVSSYVHDGSRRGNVILVISDITELTELRDAIKAMNHIRELNEQLELRNRLLKNTFGRYLSDDIVREILESPDGMKMGGQRREITIMMSDLRGFTMMCERMEPQALITMLNHYFEEMYEEISRYGGVIIEFLGDGMFVIFGAPEKNEHHAESAVAAACAMQKKMKKVNAWNREHGYEELSMGIGINTGEVIVGNIGSEKRTKYGVMGPTVNLAGRIESYTSDGQVLISESVKKAVKCPMYTVFATEVTPKGVSEPVDVHEVVGIGAPYHKYLRAHRSELVKLSEPVDIVYRPVDGKHIEKAVFPCRLLAVGRDMVMLDHENGLSLYDNVCLMADGDLYAKITAVSREGLVLTITGRPGGFDAWLEKMMKGRQEEV